MARFLERLRNTGNVRLSCETAGVPRTTIYRWRNRFATFAHDWNEAVDDACDLLEAEAWKRAIEKDSDRLLIFLLKAHRPDLYNPPQQIQQDITERILVIDWDDAADDTD